MPGNEGPKLTGRGIGCGTSWQTLLALCRDSRLRFPRVSLAECGNLTISFAGGAGALGHADGFRVTVLDLVRWIELDCRRPQQAGTCVSENSRREAAAS